MSLEKMPDPMKPVELARHWRVSADTVTRLCEAGEIPGAFRLRRQWRIPHAAVLAYEAGARETVSPDVFHVERKPAL